MKRVLFFAILGTSFLFTSACSKVEGPGGSSTITGKIHIKNFNSAGQLISEYDAPEEDVYLIYGDSDTFYDEDTKTSYDGSFEFHFLQKGKYKVFAYQDCATCPSGKEIVSQTIEITANKSTQDLGTITLNK